MATITLPIEYQTIDQAVEQLFAYIAELVSVDSYPLSKDGSMPEHTTRAWLYVHKITPPMFEHYAREYGLKFAVDKGTFTFQMDWQVFHVTPLR